MRKLHTKLTTIGLLLMVLSLPAFADKKDDLYNAAQKAIAAGDVITAARNFCDVAKIDPSYKDAQQNCNIMKDSAAREEKKNEERFNDGVKAFQAGDLETAEQKFKNVRGGVHVDEAKQYLATKIPAARSKPNPDEIASAKFSEGVGAYNSNNFGTAKVAFAAVTSGKNVGEAQTYLTKIRQYEQAIAEGDRLASAKNYRAAVSSYTDAANIKGDGPGDPRSKMSQMNQLAAGAGSGGGTTTTASNTTPSNTRSSSTLLDTGKPKLDIPRTLHEADAALAKKDYAEAKRKYGAVLAEDSRNAQAQAGLAQVKSLNTAPTPVTSAGEVDPLQPILVKAILEYYSQKFDDAEYHLRAYLDNSGSKSGLAQFYLGASRLTRYYLGGEQPSEQKLLKSAQDAFRDAKRTAGFKAPTKQYISPKILKTFEETTS